LQVREVVDHLGLRRQVRIPEGLHLPTGRRDRRGDPGGPVDPRGALRSELENSVAAQREKFITKFGRKPGPDDPIFFDLDEDQLREDTADAMRAAGISPALIYAYEETGLIVTQENRRAHARLLETAKQPDGTYQLVAHFRYLLARRG
jgi:hypothetical protein